MVLETQALEKTANEELHKVVCVQFKAAALSIEVSIA